MTKGLSNQPCVLCPNPSSRKGEHIWPSWLIDVHAADAPFRTEIAGSPVLNRDGSPSLWPALPGVHVPMCTSCNGRLNTFLEEPVQPVVRRLPLHQVGEWPVLDTAEVEVLAWWFLKITLLETHPAARHDNPQVGRRRTAIDDMPPEWLEWLRTASEPPPGFSVYATRRDHTRTQDIWTGERIRYLFPRRVRVGDRELRYFSRMAGLGSLDVTTLWHPEWPLEHPLVDVRRAARLWPDPDAVDLAAICVVHPSHFAFEFTSVRTQLSDEQFREMHSGRFGLDASPFERFMGRLT